MNNSNSNNQNLQPNSTDSRKQKGDNDFAPPPLNHLVQWHTPSLSAWEKFSDDPIDSSLCMLQVLAAGGAVGFAGYILCELIKKIF